MAAKINVLLVPWPESFVLCARKGEAERDGMDNESRAGFF
jgi:hypothetical protein